jgi:hypothetical protein
MKKLIVALLFAASFNVHADEDKPLFFTAGNNSGGTITLTVTRPDACNGLFWMYTTTSKGNSTYGCWQLLNDQVHVLYDDQSRRIYDLGGFKMHNGKPNPATTSKSGT